MKVKNYTGRPIAERPCPFGVRFFLACQRAQRRRAWLRRIWWWATSP